MFSPEEIAAENIAGADRDAIGSRGGSSSAIMEEINIDPLPREEMVIQGAEEGGKVDMRRRRMIYVAIASVVALGVILAISFPVHHKVVENREEQGAALDGSVLLLDEQTLEDKLSNDLGSSGSGISTSDSNTDTLTDDETASPVDTARAAALWTKLEEISGSKIHQADTPYNQAATWLIQDDPMQLAADSSRIAQRYVISLLYFSLNGPQWKNKTDMLSEKSECEWMGVTCNASTRHIHQIIWRNNSLEGTLPEEIAQLKHMEHLNMDENFIAQRIPGVIWTNMTDLKLLDLSGNIFSGQIPSEVSNLSNLRELDLNTNLLDGQLPTELGLLEKLQVLKLYSNSFSGSIISELGQLQQLKRLDLDDNYFRGTLPQELGHLSNLEIFWANGNYQVNGTIPQGLFVNATKLQKLFLGDLSLSGTISPDIGNLQQLQFLQLKNNQFEGTLPETIGQCSKLLALELDRNQLEGPLPSNLGNLSSLSVLYLSSNSLRSSIPAEWGNLANLTTLVASSANITGAFPSEFGKLSNLQYLLLDRNELNSTLPSEIGNLKKLSHLYLYNNKLNGQLPSELGQLSNLQELVLDQNDFTGTLPSELGQLDKLSTIFLFDNRLKGKVPPSVCQLPSLQNLWGDCQSGFNCTCCTACCIFNSAGSGCFYVGA